MNNDELPTLFAALIHDKERIEEDLEIIEGMKLKLF
jgi:hypothetical protein